jgi:transposase-like protein
MNKASPATRERWRQIIQEQKSGGLSVARFCRERQVAPSSLFAWKRRLAREAPVAATPAFVPVRVGSAPLGGERMASSEGAIELHLGQGRHVLLRPGFDVATLAAALAVLEGAGGRGERR